MTWKSVRLKHISRMAAGGTPEVSNPIHWAATDAEGYPWVSIGDMSNRRFVSHTARRITTQGLRVARLTLAPPGTLLFSIYASLGHLAVLTEPGAWNQAILGIVPDESVDSRFLAYSLEALKPRLGELARSNTQDNLNAEQVGNLPVTLPGLDEQRRIADFLDGETGRNSRLVSKYVQLRERLRAWRASVVFSLVTGQSYELRKPSGLAWVGTIPGTWRSAKISYIARMGSGHTPSRTHPEWWVNCTIPWITTGEVSQVRDDRREVIEVTREKISRTGLANSAAELHPAGTVVLCRTASAGYSGVMGTDMATSQDFATWTCGRFLDPYYLLWCLRAMRPDLLGRLAMGSTHKTIYMPDLQALKIPVPPLAEQQEIVRCIRHSNGRIDRLLDAVDGQIDNLKERRHALITAAVTGQS